MKICLIFAFTLLILVPVFGKLQERKSDSVTTEEYAVYSALLNEINQSPKNGKEVKLLVVNDRTEGPGERCLPEKITEWEKEIKADELKPLRTDLLTKNDKPYSLSKQFKLSRQYVLLNVEVFSEIFKGRGYEEGWDEFYGKYPNSSGYITFSRVGFNNDATKAIIYRETGCGSLCGYGGYILLNKENGEWKLVTGYSCWRS
jgi:hypothetical protein